MLRQLAALCCVVLAVGAVQAQQDAVGHYTIVGSKQIRPHSDYHIAVNLHDATEANSVRLTIQNAGDFKLVKEVVVQPHSTESVAFELGDIPLGGGDIKLVAEGLTGIRFRNETELVVSVKRFSVLVQTDKAMYKPGDMVRFRVLILDPNTKPLDVNGGLQVHMKDGGGNRIKQWSNETAHRGVFTGELQLSDYPVLGQWTLVVEVMGETKKKTLEVAEYVLPKFEVLIETEKDVLYKDGKISANIRGKYTYGKPVRGEATVTLQPKIRGGYQPLAGDLISRKVISKIVTKGSVEFGISEDLKLNEEYERELQMDVIFEEELTKRTQTAQTFIKIRRSHYKIAKVGGRFTYKDGEPFALELQVTRHDGRPVVDTSSPIEVSYSADQVYSADETHSETGRLDKHGRASFVLNFPANKTGFNIKAKYMDLTEGLGYVSKYSFMASQVRGLQTKVLTEKPTLGKPIIVEVESETPLDSFTYQIFGRGDIIKTETVSVSGVQRYEIKFLASFAMVPTVKIVVYHIKDGQMHSSTESITLRDSLQNTITLEPSTFETQPGKNVDLTITTRPNSYVGLLGVDQSVLLLKSGNDLTQSEVFDELDEYTKSSENANLRRFSPYGMYGSYGQSSASFDNVGAFLISNLYEPIPEYGVDFRFEEEEDEEAVAFNSLPDLAFQTESTDLEAPQTTLTIRKDFPESWIWEMISSDSPDGVHTLHKKVPDTITSWVITAFALDPVTGLALTAEPTKLKVFQPFFVSLNLPYSIKRGEVVSIPIVVFNYMESAVNAEVTLHNEDQDFEFVEISNEVEEVTPKIELFRRKRIAIKSNDGTATSFMIKPTKTGPLTIKVTATSPLAGDGVERILPVEPEGVPVYNNKAVFVDLRDTAQLTTNFTIEVPKNAVPDSTRIEVSIIGDVLGPTIQNLESLIRMPYGCGEQNMLHFVPNIVVLNYLKNTQQLNAAIEAKAKKFMEIGYQRELTYLHQDGSFSAFGQSDSSGSTWLTAFVARSFRQAADHVTVEEKIIDQALQFLAGVQADNGSFPEVGTVVHADMQGGSGQGIALTAYTLIAFLENRPAAVEKYRNVINKAMDYIVRNLEQLTDEVYAQALAAYALQLAQHNAKDYVLNTLDGHANRTGGFMFWTKPVPESERGSVWYDRPNSVNTEMTAYALLAHIEAGPYTTAIPIMKWLLAQRNAEGGFESTQDTVIGLQALAKVAEKIANTNSDMRLAVRYGEGQTRDMQLNGGNRMVMQQFVLPSGTRTVNVTASGHGFGLLSLSYQYNVNVTGAWPRFTVDPQVNRNSNADYLHLTVCTSFIPTNDTKVSNMAVMEVEFPSGFTADLDTIPSLEATENVKKVETKNGDTVMVIYFDNLSVKELCPTVDAFRTHKVAMQKPAAVTVYDYYDTARKARMFYKIPASGLCDICEEECPDSCKAQAAEQRAERPSMDGFQSGSAGRIAAQTMSALLMIGVAAMW